MNTDDKNNNTIDEILKDAHREIEPPDSWQELRTRIDSRIDSDESISAPAMGNIIFWRRLAFGMAACFVITAGILLYFLGVNYGMRGYQRTQIATANNLLNQADLNRLSFAFSQVRQLFGQQSQWIMVGSGNNTQMGVADSMISQPDNRQAIAIRLAVNLDSTGSSQQYFDVVAFSNQQANFQLPLADASAIDVSLRPIVKSDGTIEIEITARANSSSEAKSVNTVVDSRFTSLVHMLAHGKWVSINGTGQVVSEI